ncbi:hypothetical protein KW799_01195, partial [Candidatus Parcubacteria bacterium]|nr:hypothetical protein [Candidatus Parcubacteria bacterium]
MRSITKSAAAFGISVVMAASAVVAVFPAAAFAQAASDSGTGSDNPKATNFQLVPCTGVVDPKTGKGVECDFNQLIVAFNRAVKFLLYLS